VTSTIFGSTVGYPSDSLASCSLSSRRRKVDVKSLSDQVGRLSCMIGAIVIPRSAYHWR